MAATRLMPLHINKGWTLAQSLNDRTDYPAEPTFRDFICKSIDQALIQKSADFEAFLQLLENSGYSRKFLEEHREEITIHRAAKAAFDQLENTDTVIGANGKQRSRIPSVKELNREYAEVLSGKKKAYLEYRAARREMQDLLIARK